jgi:Tfp pilus assembly pilus retraction ATPase PilT
MRSGQRQEMVTMDESCADKYRQSLMRYERAIAHALDSVVLTTPIGPVGD